MTLRSNNNQILWKWKEILINLFKLLDILRKIAFLLVLMVSAYFRCILFWAACSAPTKVLFNLPDREFLYFSTIPTESSAICSITSLEYRQPRNSTFVKTRARQTISSSSNLSRCVSIKFFRWNKLLKMVLKICLFGISIIFIPFSIPSARHSHIRLGTSPRPRLLLQFQNQSLLLVLYKVFEYIF